jgi:hypothetical protein
MVAHEGLLAVYGVNGIGDDYRMVPLIIGTVPRLSTKRVEAGHGERNGRTAGYHFGAMAIRFLTTDRFNEKNRAYRIS